MRNGANMTGAHHIYPDKVSKVMSQNYGQGWVIATLDKSQRKVCSFERMVVSKCSEVFTFGSITIKFHRSDLLNQNISKFRDIAALGASPCEQFKT